MHLGSLDFSKERETMVAEQIEAKGIRDRNVLAAFKKVCRERFIPEEYRPESYGDHPVPIGSGQTISQPYMVALMTDLLKLKREDRVLEIGTGSGYQTAILAEISAQVFTIEKIPGLGEKAGALLHDLGYADIKLKVDDGSCGWKEHAPYNGIVVTCGAPSVPAPLKAQLADRGRLVVPVGGDFSQVLTVIERNGSEFKESKICGCVFVPLIGKYGWR